MRTRSAHGETCYGRHLPQAPPDQRLARNLLPAARTQFDALEPASDSDIYSTQSKSRIIPFGTLRPLDSIILRLTLHGRTECGFTEVYFGERAPDLHFRYVLHVLRENDCLLVVGTDEGLG